MANTKANIQNIPLTGTLNFNTLKTDVKPFQGYNEKNSTVFGGTLGPFYDKKTELYDADSSYTLFNSNGDPFTLRNSTDSFEVIDKAGNTIAESDCALCITKKLVNLPDDTFWAAQFNTKGPNSDYKSVCQLAITNDGKFYYRICISTGSNHPLEDIDDVTWSDPIDYSTYLNSNVLEAIACFTPDNDSFIFGTCSIDSSSFRTLSIKGHFDEPDFTINSTIIHSYANFTSTNAVRSLVTSSSTPCISIYGNEVHFISNSGKLSKFDINNLIIIDHNFYNNTYTTTEYNATSKVWRFPNFQSRISFTFGPTGSVASNLKDTNYITAEVYQLDCRRASCTNEANLISLPIQVGSYYTGHDGNGFIPTPTSHDGFITYLGGSLLSISPFGRWSIPINTPSNFSNSIISYAIYNSTEARIQNINYKGGGNSFYCFINNRNDYYNSNVAISQRLKDMTINNRYIILGSKGIFDVETGNIIKGSKYLGYIETGYPGRVNAVTSAESLYTSVYSGGYNAGYQINNNSFVGYLFDGAVLRNCPPNCTFLANLIANPDLYNIQRYFTEDVTVSVAYYIGSNPMYTDTYMPALSSVMLPYSLNARMTTGYGNNNFIQVDTTSYFLATFNNNTNLYSAFWETKTENITGVFSIQSQRYVVDENNVYLANYAYGSAANVFTVGAYKKNLKYIGSLPTMAIFWSEFNKSFYSFSGDSILRKYFEASDINEIYYVGQNPSSQSLWICTDKGIYIISDSDQYKLNFISKQVDFKEGFAIIVSEENNKWVEHKIALYNIDDTFEEVPIKLKTCFYGLGSNRKANFDCWYIRVFDPKREGNYLKLKVNTITDVSRHTEEKVFNFSPSDYDENNIAYVKYQPKYQEAVAMQIELESDIQIYQIDLGVNVESSVVQLSHNNF